MRATTLSIKVKATINDGVYLVADDKQEGYLVTGYTLGPKNQVLYRLSNANSTYYAYDFEFIDEKRLV